MFQKTSHSVPRGLAPQTQNFRRTKTIIFQCNVTPRHVNFEIWAVNFFFRKLLFLRQQSFAARKYIVPSRDTVSVCTGSKILQLKRPVLFQGYVAFSSQGDRIALTQIEQVIDGKYVKLGYYDTQSDNLTWFDKERWISKCIFDQSSKHTHTTICFDRKPCLTFIPNIFRHSRFILIRFKFHIRGDYRPKYFFGCDNLSLLSDLK